jgi:type I restriction enzyme S subunit
VIQGLVPYPSMKDSGVPSLGAVPAGWAVRRLRNVAAMRVSNVDKLAADGEEPVRLCNYVDVYKNDYIDASMPFMRATATKEEIARFRLATGDVLITKDSETWNDIAVPALVRGSADDLISGYHLALLRPFPEFVLGAYLFRTLQSRGVACQFHVGANGVTRYGLSHEAIKSVWLPVPPVSEQSSIVRFLDHADRRIRRYIRAKQKLITLLEAQKQAIVYHAVIRGLDPKVQLRASGVAWLGAVPSHWFVASLRFRYHQCLGKMVDAKRQTGKCLVPYLRNVDVQWDRINTRDLPQIDIAAEERGRYTVKVGDLLVCEGRHLGRAAFWRGELAECGFQKALHRLRPLNPATDVPRWLFYCLYVVHLLDAFGASSADSSIPHLTGEMLRAHKFPFPPVEEQNTIAVYLDERVQTLEQAQAAVASEIRHVREYRTRLVADVVTGKLDVREAAARLSDEVDDAGPLDDAEADADAEALDAEGEVGVEEADA